ncbi:MAG: hypothetical protein M1820_005192 [Bogoriella megaspora]|nr:MAG: hypothetical protein M1820_005192 [Bogoriella megaspora]
MADTSVKAVEPDPAATSISNDQSVNDAHSEQTVATAKEPIESLSEEHKQDSEAGNNIVIGEAEQGKENGVAKDKDIPEEDRDKDDKSQDGSSDRISQAQNYNRSRGSGSHRRGRDRRDHRDKPYSKGNTRHGDRSRGKPNNKGLSRFNPRSMGESQDKDEIRKQARCLTDVEFYFSDANLPKDRYLMGLVGGSKNKPVPIKVIHDFKRMTRFQPHSLVVEALMESKVLETTGERNEEIKRRVPLDPKFDGPVEDNVKILEDDAMARTVYVKGFGREQPNTQYAIEGFFEPYGPVLAVRLRRTDDKYFKGSVYVEFESEGLAKAFLDLDPKPRFNGHPLRVLTKVEYLEEQEEQEARKKREREDDDENEEVSAKKVKDEEVEKAQEARKERGREDDDDGEELPVKKVKDEETEKAEEAQEVGKERFLEDDDEEGGVPVKNAMEE